MAAEQKPPFTPEIAIAKVRGAEDAWNRQDPEAVAMAYTSDSWWRNRSSFVQGREEIMEFLRQKWARELNYRLIKEMWACTDNRIAVRYCYESQSISGQWYRSYGNENREFDDDGLMARAATPASTTSRSTPPSASSTGRSRRRVRRPPGPQRPRPVGSSPPRPARSARPRPAARAAQQPPAAALTPGA